MKRILFLFFVLLMGSVMFAKQDPILKFYMSDGSFKQFNLSEIDNLGLLPGNENSDLYVYYRDSLTSIFPSKNIEKITFEVDSSNKAYLDLTVSGNLNRFLLSEVDSLVFINPNIIKPIITSVNPDSGRIGDTVTISGKGFGANRNDSKVILDSAEITDYLSWSDSEIKIIIPDGASSGKISVLVSSQKSNEVDFIVIPKIESITPSSARIGELITIKGNGFGTEQDSGFVSFNSSVAAEYAKWCDTLIVVTVPSGTYSGMLSVTASGKKSNEIEFKIIPQITGISPIPAKAGDILTISGTGFGTLQGTSIVQFNTITATEISSWNDLEIKVKVPQGVSSGKVSVTVNGQKSNEVDLTLLTQIMSINPNSSIIGEIVTISGSGFKSSPGTSFVTFNEVKAVQYVNWKENEIRVKVPSGATSGKVSVNVDGKSSNEVDFFVIPHILSITPAIATIGTNITINGTGFGNNYGNGIVSFFGATGTEISSWTDNQIIVRVPPGTQTGFLTVSVSEQKSNEIAFFVIPTITSINPTSEIIGNEITITGNGFFPIRNSGTVSFNGAVATEYTSWSDNQIVVKVPQSATTGKLFVTASSQKSNEVDFTVKPHLTFINPSLAIIGDEITFTGSGLGSSRGTSVLSFSGADAIEFISWSSTQIKAKVPRGAVTGKVSVTVGVNKSNEIDFTIVPHISSISPTASTIGTEISIIGSGFGLTRSSSIATFNSKNAVTFNLWCDTLIKVLMPLGAETGKLSVTASYQKSNEVDFTVIPFIANINPTSGIIGDEITIIGNGFGSTEGMSFVTFSTANGTEYARWSDTLIKVKVPTGASTGKLSVTASLMKSNEKDFTVIPHINNISPTAAKIGDNITISGNGFGSTQGTGFVSFTGGNATEIISWNDVLIVVKVPAGALTGKMSVTASGQKSNEKDFLVIPQITGTSSTWGYVGDEITISGTGFGTSRDTSKVSFGTTNASDFTSWSSTQIRVKVPSGVPAGTLKLSVTASGQKSNEYDFSVKPKITSINPTSATIGDTLTINGTTFGSTRGANNVSINGTNANTYINWSETQIKIRIIGYSSGKVKTTINSQISNEVDLTIDTTGVRIGNQIWMTKNLDVSTYRNGDTIPQVTYGYEWDTLTTGAWCYYYNSSTYGAIYGKLYNWYATNDTRGLAPEGWHIPSSDDYAILQNYLGGESVAGGKLKESGFTHWSSPNYGATNETFFTGLPGGFRASGGGSPFLGINIEAGFHTTASDGLNTYSWALVRYSSGFWVGSALSKCYGMSVRCIKN